MADDYRIPEYRALAGKAELFRRLAAAHEQIATQGKRPTHHRARAAEAEALRAKYADAAARASRD